MRSSFSPRSWGRPQPALYFEHHSPQRVVETATAAGRARSLLPALDE